MSDFKIICEIIPRSKRSSEHTYEVYGYDFDAEKVYRLDECNKEKIKEIFFLDCYMRDIPKIINLHQFPNLKVFQIDHSELETIKKADLNGLENIQGFWLPNNKLEYLPGNLLENMKNLNHVSFCDNRIEYIGRKLIDSLKKLDHCNFENNVNIDRYYRKNDSGSGSFKKMEKHILEKCGVLEEFEAENKRQHEIDRDERTKDFTVIIQDHKFKVHKFMLMARSQLLYEMIEKNPDSILLHLYDISIGIFESILKFMYEDVFPPDDANFKDIFLAAGRLKIDVLKNYAADKLIEQVDEDSAFEYSILANKYEHDGLRVKAFAKIKEMFPDKKLSEAVARDTEKIHLLRELKEEQAEFLKKINEKWSKLNA